MCRKQASGKNICPLLVNFRQFGLINNFLDTKIFLVFSASEAKKILISQITKIHDLIRFLLDIVFQIDPYKKPRIISVTKAE